MGVLVSEWSPNLIVELVKSVAWPIVALLIGLSFRIKIFDVIRSFFTKNTVSEISATITGLSAKFKVAQQSAEALEMSNVNSPDLSKNLSAEAIKERHDNFKTEYSEELYQSTLKHALSLNIDNKEKIELLSREVSLYQSAIKYIEINKVLFRSQYELFFKITIAGGYISKEDIISHFDKIKKENTEAFAGWDWITYIAYPVSIGIIHEKDNFFELTLMGRSYMTFMSKNTQFIEEISKL